MSGVSFNQSTSTTNLHGTQGVQGTDNAQQNPTGDQTVQVKANGVARAAQQSIVDGLKKDFSVRDIKPSEVLSKDGMKAVIGKASIYARIKDSMMRSFYKGEDGQRLAPDRTVGSNHKSAIRLAEHYENLKQNGGTDRELRDTLFQLKEKLGNIEDRRNANALLTGNDNATEGPIPALLKFIDHELDTLPSHHLSKANRLMTELSQLKNNEGSLHKKTQVLERLIDHLNGADPEATNAHLQGVKKDYEEELSRYKSHENIKGGIVGYGAHKLVATKDGNVPLKHANTVVTDPLDSAKFELHQKKIDSDPLRKMQQTVVGMEVEMFDRSTLKHVETNERTGLESAKKEYLEKSKQDEGILNNPKTFNQGKAPEISEVGTADLPSCLNDNAFKDIGSRLTEALRANDKAAAKQLALELGQLIGKDITASSDDVQFGFATSGGQALKEELFQLIGSQKDAGREFFLGLTTADAPHEIRQFLDVAFQEALSVLPDRQIDADHLMMGGVLYTKGPEIGKGGFGKVCIYEGQKNGKKDTIVVKESLDPDPSIRTEMGREARAHYSASHHTDPQKANENIVQFRGAIQGAKGELFIAMEYVPNGNLADAAVKIKDAEKAGLISPTAANAARMTLILDMVKGLKHLQESQGMTHFDLKMINYFLGADGIGKLGDYGTSVTSLSKTFSERITENPRYAPPEVYTTLLTYVDNKKRMGRIEAQLNRIKTSLKSNEVDKAAAVIQNMRSELLIYRDEIGNDPNHTINYAKFNQQLIEIQDAAGKNPMDADQTKALLQKLLDEFTPVVKKELKALDDHPTTFEATGATDVWALGISIYEMFYDELLFDDDFVAQIEQQLADYGNNESSRFDTTASRKGTTKSDGSGPGSGAGALSRLLNVMLHRDPDQRPSLTDIQAHSLFSDPEIGSDNARNLIKVLTDPTRETDPAKEQERVKDMQAQLKQLSESMGS